jgi:hypothetical protein
VLYCVPAQVSPYIGVVTADASEEGTEVTQTVTGHNRRRYPGGPSISVEGHDRDRIVGGYGAKQTLPGKNAWFERTTGIGPLRTREVRQFTFVGTTKQLRDYVEANAVGTFTLRTPDGEPVPMAE